MKKNEFDFRSINSIETALKVTGKIMPDFSGIPEDRRDRYMALFEMETIIEAINNGWVPDWEDTDQPKWRSWFWMSPSGFAFSYSDYVSVTLLRVAGLAFILKRVRNLIMLVRTRHS